MSDKERGFSLIQGKKPVYSSKNRVNKVLPVAESGQVPDPIQALVSAAANPMHASASVPVLPKAPADEVEALSLDQQLRKKAEEAERLKNPEAEPSESAAPVPTLGSPLAPDNGLNSAQVNKQKSRPRQSVRQSMLKHQALRGSSGADVSEEKLEEKLEEDMGHAFKGMWGALGITAAYSKVKEKAVAAAAGVHPAEIMERVTNGFPRRAYKGKHHTLQKKVDQEAHLKMKEEEMKALFGKDKEAGAGEGAEEAGGGARRGRRRERRMRSVTRRRRKRRRCAAKSSPLPTPP
jgi:hypothetical protein